MKRFGWTVAALTMVLAACGGDMTSPEPAAEELGATEGAIIPVCDQTKSFTLRYYSTFDKTQEVGRSDCDCGVAANYGKRTSYYDVQYFNGGCF